MGKSIIYKSVYFFGILLHIREMREATDTLCSHESTLIHGPGFPQDRLQKHDTFLNIHACI